MAGPIIFTKVLDSYFKKNKNKVKFFEQKNLKIANGTIYNNNMRFDGTNGYYRNKQNNKDNHYTSDKYKNEKLIL